MLLVESTELEFCTTNHAVGAGIEVLLSASFGWTRDMGKRVASEDVRLEARGGLVHLAVAVESMGNPQGCSRTP